MTRPRTCPDCFETHPLTGCGGDAKKVAEQWAATHHVDPVARWILSFADKDPNHLSDDEIGWFHDLTGVPSFVGRAAQAAFDDRAADADASGHWVGVAKTRGPFTLTVDAVEDLGVHEQYGQRFLVRMTAACGAKCVWFTGENLWMDEGKTYDVTARVEDHSVFRGVRQTRMSRIKKGTA